MKGKLLAISIRSKILIDFIELLLRLLVVLVVAVKNVVVVMIGMSKKY